MESKTIKSYEKLRLIYEKNLNVDLLAENISTCYPYDDALVIKNEMSNRDFDVYGVVDKGKTTGYVLKEELSDGFIIDFFRPFQSEELITDSTPLIFLLDILRSKKYLFILEKNIVGKIVTIADLHKQPIRMLAFSLISILEMLLISLINDEYSNGNWKDKLSKDRLLKAEEMLNKRIEKNEALTLLDNTQLGDKGTIVRKTPELLNKLGFESIKKCKDFFKNVEDLRNNIAHAQEEIYHDWRELINIILQLDSILNRSVLSKS